MYVTRPVPARKYTLAMLKIAAYPAAAPLEALSPSRIAPAMGVAISCGITREICHTPRSFADDWASGKTSSTRA